MKRWRLQILARKLGNLEVKQRFTIVVEAENRSLALLKAYEGYRRIIYESVVEL